MSGSSGHAGSKPPSAFGRALASCQPPDHSGRRWLFVPYDQLSDQIGPLAREPVGELGIIVVENPWKAARRPYHRQKLVAVIANLRHFALEQARRGVTVRHVVARGPYRDALQPLAAELGPIRVCEPSERELRTDLAPLVATGAVQVIPNESWLTTVEDFRTSQPSPPYRMERFYRRVRQRTGLLMDSQGKPVGGKFSFDVENRKRWPGHPPAAEPPSYVPDAITTEVGELVATHFDTHPGTIDLQHLATTADDARAHWAWAMSACLPLFGPYEDAMTVRSRTLFHSRTSMLVNLGRLQPRALIRDVADLPIDLASKEGFIRQLLGWREFMHHVHVATDGFRGTATASDEPASPSLLGARDPLPPVYWGTPSGLHCLDTIVKSVWDEGYSHHITRLMVLSNLASLLEVSPRELTDWFWVAYTDAYDWVVEPNVLAMGTWACGDLVVTKPYVASANYIDKQSDYCKHCQFDPKTNCPVTPLYWAFLERHREMLASNPRLIRSYDLLAKRDAARKRSDIAVFERVRDALAKGKRLGV